jgi:DNA-directed RNA polymerase beta subunit
MLPHHVVDKITTRGGTGGIDPLTHQPGGGFPSGGGRSGEMERDAMLSHGATSLLMERFCTSSDQFTAIMCLNCGTPAVNENHTDNYVCKKCKEKGKFARLKYPYSTMYLQHMLSALGLDTRFRLRLGGTYITEADVKKEEVVFKDEEGEGEGEGEGEEEEYEEQTYLADDLFEGGGNEL